MDDYGKSSTGLEENVVAAASYFLALGFIVLMIEKKSHFVRFHALQSTLAYSLLAIFWMAIEAVPSLHILSFAPGLLALFICVCMMIKSYDGEEYKLPLIGKLAFAAVYETGPEREDLLAAPPAADDPEKKETTEGK